MMHGSTTTTYHILDLIRKYQMYRHNKYKLIFKSPEKVHNFTCGTHLDGQRDQQKVNDVTGYWQRKRRGSHILIARLASQAFITLTMKVKVRAVLHSTHDIISI